MQTSFSAARVLFVVMNLDLFTAFVLVAVVVVVPVVSSLVSLHCRPAVRVAPGSHDAASDIGIVAAARSFRTATDAPLSPPFSSSSSFPQPGVAVFILGRLRRRRDRGL
jgi:hypothetical protein